MDTISRAVPRPEPIKQTEITPMSKTAVEGVTDAVNSVTEVGKLANDVKTELQRDMADVTDALHQTREFSKSLRGAGAGLRGALGILGNNPPSDN